MKKATMTDAGLRLTPCEAPPVRAMGIDTTPEEWAAAHRALLPGHVISVTPWGAICECAALWSRDPAKGGEARNRPMPPQDVAIGDTFAGVVRGRRTPPWEVTGQEASALGEPLSTVTGPRGVHMTIATSDLLDPQRWRRARAL